ncbi:Phage regulatory protein CII [Pseudomonas savastanoi pv. glycinea]|nr:Phage regulatory protein CII [Pseudomonas savastanoi pv. glycinea]
MEAFLDACQAAVKENEPKVLAAKMGLSHVSLLQRANPDNDAHHMTIEHLFGLMLHTGDHRPLQVLARELGFEVVARVPQKPVSLNQALLHLSSEMAEVTLEVCRALEDGRVCQTEKASISREIGHTRQKLDLLEESVKVA